MKENCDERAGKSDGELRESISVVLLQKGLSQKADGSWRVEGAGQIPIWSEPDVNTCVSTAENESGTGSIYAPRGPEMPIAILRATSIGDRMDPRRS